MAKKSKFKFIFLTIVTLIIVGVVAIFFLWDSALNKVIRNVTTYLTGTETQLNSTDFSPINGSLNFDRFAIENPSGFSDVSAIAFDEFFVSVDIASISTNKIVVNEVRIVNPIINFELKAPLGSNLGTIKEHIDKVANAQKQPAQNQPTTPTQEQTTTTSNEHAKHIVIRKLTITNATVEARAVAGTVSTTLTLPPIELNNLGENKLLTVAEIVAIVFNEILLKTTNATLSANINEQFNNVSNQLEDKTLSTLERIDKRVTQVGEKLTDSIDKGVENVTNKIDDFTNNLF